MLWVLPPFIALALAVILAISARVSSAAAAQQASGAGDPAADRHRVRGVERHALPRRGRGVRHRRPRVVRRDLRAVARVEGRLPRTPPRHGRRLTTTLRRTCVSSRRAAPIRRVAACTRASRRCGSGWPTPSPTRRPSCRATAGSPTARSRTAPRAWRRALAAYGVGHDTKVALFLHNCPEYMELLFALSKLRAVPANVNFRYLGDELAQLVDNADAEVLVYHRSLRRPRRRRTRPHAERSATSSRSTTTGRRLRVRGAPPRARARSRAIERSGDDLLLWYTGGTTGLPEGRALAPGHAAQLRADRGATRCRARRPTVAELDRARSRRRALARSRHAARVAAHHPARARDRGAPGQHRVRGRRHDRAARRGPHRRRRHLRHHRSASGRACSRSSATCFMRRIARALDAADARGEPYDLSSLRRIHNSGAMVSAPLKDALLHRGTMHVYDSLGSSEAVGFGRRAHHRRRARARPHAFVLGPNAAAARRGRPRRASSPVRARSACSRCTRRAPSATTRTPSAPRPRSATIDGRPYAIPGDQATARRRRHAHAARARLRTASTPAARRSGPRRSRRC